jgi:prolyl oligopeptidase
VNLVTTDRRSGVTLLLAFLVSTVGHWIYRLAIPTLILTITGSALTRVDPLHARRMCAALQAVGAPALLRRDAAAGHGERDRTGRVAYFAEVLAFLHHNLIKLTT